MSDFNSLQVLCIHCAAAVLQSPHFGMNKENISFVLSHCVMVAFCSGGFSLTFTGCRNVNSMLEWIRTHRSDNRVNLTSKKTDFNDTFQQQGTNLKNLYIKKGYLK